MKCPAQMRFSIFLIFAMVFWGNSYRQVSGEARFLDTGHVGTNTESSTLGLSGGFIQYQGFMMKNRHHPNNVQGLDKATWQRELEAMHRAGMDTIFIQRTEGDGESFIPDVNDSDAVDATEVILSCADNFKMKIYVGLWSGDWPFADVVKANSGLLDRTKKEDLRVANVVWDRYGKGKHESFTGWYIPQEIWNINWKKDENERIRSFFREVSHYLKHISNNEKMPVALSPFFSPYGDALDEDVVAAVYTAFLKGDDAVPGAGVDLLLIQDGVGARCRDTASDIAVSLPPYFRGFRRAAAEASKARPVSVWGDIEAFKTVHGGCRDDKPLQLEPAEFNRVALQLETASIDQDSGRPFFEKLVAFDFFHYMSPVHMGTNFAARQRLYSAYLNWLGSQPRQRVRSMNK